MSIAGKPIDIALLLEEARKENSGISGSELAYITDICQKSALSHKFEGYVDKLKELSKKRQALKTAVELIPLIEKNDKDFDQHIDAAIKNLSGLECIESKVKTLGEIIHETYFLEELKEKTDYYHKYKIALKDENVLPTGFPSMDGILGGLFPTRLYVVGARPGVGKTALALNISLATANLKKDVLFFSLEMSKKEIRNRYVSSYAGVRMHDIQAGTLTHDEYNKVASGVEELKKLPLHIMEGGLSGNKLRSVIRTMKRRNNIKMVVIDYLQLLGGIDSNDTVNRYQQVTELSSKMKRIAIEFDIVVICLSQLSRQSEMRQTKTPQLSDLRDSGAIEQDADVVTLLSRGEGQSYSKLHIAKNRHGTTGCINLNYEGSTVTFKDQNEY